MNVKKSIVAAFGRARHFAGAYKFGIASSLAIFLIWSISAAAVWSHFEKSNLSDMALQRQNLKDMDETIKRLKVERAAKMKLEEEKKASEAAEAKKKAEEEAKEAAEASKNSTVSVTGCNPASSHNNPSFIDILVNKKHCLSPLGFIPADLVSTHGATISAKAASDFNRMFADAANAGQPFTASSSYRSYDNQVSTYNYWVSLNGQQGADTVSARPGFSEHQTGLAVDVGAYGCNLDCFGGTSQYQWLQTHAAAYGFIQRYYKEYEHVTGYSGEEWHYRYRRSGSG